ncbi:DNA methyltransferase [Agromyces sp. NDB4Y10]|uniref:DNA methyltransferase n=1 Tax=Agromyces sp. NDB4Y10 TaxID=1775951 RepID=UPI000836D028|nr:DNA methyltransferase [Agromyces sp. NDB4Y10]
MSNLSNLLRQVEQKDPELADDIRDHIKALAARREFGLNFERHTPETVELPGRPIRKGDKVRFLAPRGENPMSVDQRLWRVVDIGRIDGGRVASLAREGRDGSDVETASRACDDLVVVAEFRDPIYPGLVSTGRVARGGEKPCHSVINAENFHALQTLLYTHEGKIDAIYIDPPYNSGSRDWKYNNDYVDGEDLYRHSKWLAFMDRRLRLAKRLLNPADSVLIVTIDEKEYLRLGLLLQQIFPESTVEMVTTVVNPRGRHRPGRFARSEEYIFFVMMGDAAVGQEEDPSFTGGTRVPWRTLRRSDAASARGTAKGGPSQFYPIYVTEAGTIEEIGDALAPDTPRDEAPQREGCTAVFPIRDSGLEMNWGLTAPALREINSNGFVRVGRHTPSKPQKWEISYLTSGKIADIEGGRAAVIGHEVGGAVIAEYVTDKLKTPTSTWVRPSHNAEVGGTLLLAALLPDRRFPFPKSLYAVEDALRLFIKDKPRATVLDFFAGSGTTAHAVMRLNRQHGGQRQAILVTNNEVSAGEQAELRARKLRPGDADWESLGICDYITKPRLHAAVMGTTPDGDPIEGDYKFTDGFPMAEGFEENVEFFTMTYEAPRRVAHNRSFEAVAPLLWLRAGAEGSRIDKAAEDFAVADTYGVLFDLDASQSFLRALADAESVRAAFIVTDDDRPFQMVCSELPPHVEPVRLYESYLTNFTINTGRE